MNAFFRFGRTLLLCTLGGGAGAGPPPASVDSTRFTVRLRIVESCDVALRAPGESASGASLRPGEARPGSGLLAVRCTPGVLFNVGLDRGRSLRPELPAPRTAGVNVALPVVYEPLRDPGQSRPPGVDVLWSLGQGVEGLYPIHGLLRPASASGARDEDTVRVVLSY